MGTTRDRCTTQAIFNAQDALAKNLLRNKGIICVDKVTRSGCTISLCKASYELNEKVLVIYPTRRIAREIETKIPQILRQKPRIAIIGQNTELCKKLNPKLDLKFQFKKDCSLCEFKGEPKDCTFQDLLMNDSDLYLLTYDKLRALQKSESEESSTFLEKLRNCGTIILDEFTTAVIQDIPSIEVVTSSENGQQLKSSTHLVSSFADEVERSHKKNRESDFWMTILLFLGQFENIKESGVYKNDAVESLSKYELSRLFVYGWNRITELTAEGRDTSKLQDTFLTSLAREIIVTVENGTVKVTPRLEDALGYIREFTQTLGEDKIVFAVDSYQPSVDFNKVFGRYVTHKLWGENGDPLHTNSQQLIICDRAHWGARDFCKDSVLQGRIRAFVEELLRQFSPQKFLIVTTNRKMTRMISTWNFPEEVKLTYHRSDWMRGVSVEDRRIMLCIGGPYIPKTAYVPESHSFDIKDFSERLEDLSDEQKAIQISRILKADDTKSEFINAIGRVKDPRGRERSLVITRGMTYLDARALLKRKDELSISRPYITRPYSMGGLRRDGLWIAKLWMDKANVRAEDLPVVARIVRCAKEKREISASQVIPHQTRLVIEKAKQYRETLEQYDVVMISKQGGVSFEQI